MADVVDPLVVGSQLPDVKCFDEELNLVPIRDIFAGKKGILFGVPGAFTPTCSSRHVPGYLKKENREALAAKDVDVVVCVSVNDQHVMRAWAEATGALATVTGPPSDGPPLRMLADRNAELSRALGVADGKYVQSLGSLRCRRFAMLVEDNVVTSVKVEEPSSKGAPTCSFAEDMLNVI